MKRVLKILSGTLTLCIAVIYILGGGLGSPNFSYKNTTYTKFAHRGCCKSVPRNSITAFRKAVAANLAIETDVRMTSDGVLVLFHDDSTGAKLGVKGRIADYSYSELSQLPFLYNDSATDEYLVTLEHLIDKYPYTPIYLDIKTPSKRVADALLTLLSAREYANYIIADANIVFLSYLKQKNPEIVTAWEGFDDGKEWTYSLVPKNFKPNYLASFRHTISSSHMDWLEDKGLLASKIVYGSVGSEHISLEMIPYQIVECD